LREAIAVDFRCIHESAMEVTWIVTKAGQQSCQGLPEKWHHLALRYTEHACFFIATEQSKHMLYRHTLWLPARMLG
jgi:hypothetical protein